MSLQSVNLSTIVMKQYKYKLKAYVDSLTSLIITQLIAVLLTMLGGIASSGGSRGDGFYSISIISSDLVLAFTFIWAFITGVTITTKPYRYTDYNYVANRLSSHLANSLYLISISIFAGITAICTHFLIKVGYSMIGNGLVFDGGLSILTRPSDLVIGIIAAFFYSSLFAMLGYVIGMFVQLHRIFVILIPVILIGEAIIAQTGKSIVINFFTLFFTEPSFLIFSLKIIATMIILFIIAAIVSNRLEVR